MAERHPVVAGMTTKPTERSFVGEAGKRADYPGLPQVKVWRSEKTKPLPSGGTYYEAITFTVMGAATCPVCRGPICEDTDEAVYLTAAKVTIEPAPPVGEERPYRVKVWQADEWLTDHEVIRAISRCLDYAAEEVEEWAT